MGIFKGAKRDFIYFHYCNPMPERFIFIIWWPCPLLSPSSSSWSFVASSGYGGVEEAGQGRRERVETNREIGNGPGTVPNQTKPLTRERDLIWRRSIDMLLFFLYSPLPGQKRDLGPVNHMIVSAVETEFSEICTISRMCFHLACLW